MGFMDEGEGEENLTDKFDKLKKEANLKLFSIKEKINDLGREKRKVESKKDKDAEDAKNIRQLQQNTQQLVNQQGQAQQMMNHLSLGEKILKCYFAYKIASLLLDSDRSSGAPFNNNHRHHEMDEDEVLERHNNDIDVNTSRADHIEHVRDTLDSINDEAKTLGITQDDTFNQDDKNKLTELAEISRDTNNPEQAELYADKCAELGLDRTEALQAFHQDKNIDEIKNTKEQEQSYEIER